MKVSMMVQAGVALCGMFCSVGAMAADASHGKELFVACAACHAERPDAIGPNLKGVFGRKSAALDDFRYSNPMKRANLVWNAANLRDYLLDRALRSQGVVSLDSVCHLDAGRKPAIRALIWWAIVGGRNRRRRESGALDRASNARRHPQTGRCGDPYPLAVRSAHYPAQETQALLRLRPPL